MTKIVSIHFVKECLSFSGRISRQQWLIQTFFYLLGLMAVIANPLSDLKPLFPYPWRHSYVISINLLLGLILFFLLWFGLARNAKRFHDFNKSGWVILWVIPASFVAGIIPKLFLYFSHNILFSDKFRNSFNNSSSVFTGAIAFGMLLYLMPFIPYLILWIILGGKRGNDQANQYGPSPSQDFIPWVWTWKRYVLVVSILALLIVTTSSAIRFVHQIYTATFGTTETAEKPDINKLAVAADERDLDAQMKLVQLSMYPKDGSKPDLVTANMWLYILASEGDEKSKKYFDTIEKYPQMLRLEGQSPEALQRGKAQADEWLKNHTVK